MQGPLANNISETGPVAVLPTVLAHVGGLSVEGTEARNGMPRDGGGGGERDGECAYVGDPPCVPT
jgi:hypothetical protein